jgi:prepilin-type N-terminal cleavage/methylation domain-containing protein/prepilin-type processing-associated H-X9-DG protein
MKVLRRCGFTLVELMVVVAVIALLVAILLPSLARAKTRAVRVKCGTTLHEWGEVIYNYSTANDGIFTTANWSDTTSGPYSSFTTVKSARKARDCPAVTDISFQQIHYAMVWYLGVQYSVGSQPTKAWRMVRFKRPRTTLLMIDATGLADAFSIVGDLAVRSPDMPAALKDRHDGIGNAMFLDGHVENVSFSDYQKNIPASATDLSRTWTFINTY